MSEIAAKTGGSLSWPGIEPRAAVTALALVVLGDFLFIGHRPGVSLFVFFAAIVAAILVVGSTQPKTARVAFAAAIALLGALPLTEAISLWGLLSATFGVTILGLAVWSLLPQDATDLPAILVRFGILTPVRLAADALLLFRQVAERRLGHVLVRTALMWVVPLILALVFVGLFAAANPLIESALMAIKLDSMLSALDPGRVVFWGIVAVFVWPFLIPRLLRPRSVPIVYGPHAPKAEGVLFGRGAVLRALVLFNGLFAIQSGLDIAYLWGGVALPPGMTYAGYAHRGAYPLIVTALLAASFVLAAMRPNGPAEQSSAIRYLVYAFIAQNVLLVGSSLLRLELYVETYSLTELRVAAGIWMSLVAVGLVLILTRIALRKSNRWLIATNLLSLGLTLYACAWVDFPAQIARFNVEHSYEVAGKGTRFDLDYLKCLGPSVIPALDDYLNRTAERFDAGRREVGLTRNELAWDFLARPDDWRSWTFRDWRLEQYLAGADEVAQSSHDARTGCFID